MENDQVKLLWNFRIQTDRHQDRNRPNIVVLEKGERESAKDLELQKCICHPHRNGGSWGSEQTPEDKNTWDTESLFVRQSQDFKKDPGYLRLKELA